MLTNSEAGYTVRVPFQKVQFGAKLSDWVIWTSI